MTEKYRDISDTYATGRINWILKKQYAIVWIGFIWLRVRTYVGIVGFSEMLTCSSESKEISGPQGIISTESVL
jgi:hypothetical protein